MSRGRSYWRISGVIWVVFGNVTTGRNGTLPGVHEVIGPCVNMLPTRLDVGKYSNGSRQQMLRDLVEASALQVDERYLFEGLDWKDVVDNCTNWPKETKYRSSVQFRNMDFKPELNFITEGSRSNVMLGWMEVVATPQWTTILAFSEGDDLRIWVHADPKEIGDDGADEILKKLAQIVSEILLALKDHN